MQQYTLPLLNNMQAPPTRESSRQLLMRTVSISILVMSLPVLYVSFLHVPPAALFRDTTFWFLMSNSIIIVIAADSGMLFFRSSSSLCSADDGRLPFVVSGDDDTVGAVKDGHAAASASDEAVLLLPVEAIESKALVVREHGDLTTVVAENDHAPESREIMVVSPSSADADAGEAVDGAVVRASGGRPGLTASRSLAREERVRRRHGHHRPSQSQALVPVQGKSVVVATEGKYQQLRRAATEGRPPAAAAEEKESEYSRLSDEELNRRVEEFITRFNREIRLQVEREQQLALAAA